MKDEKKNIKNKLFLWWWKTNFHYSRMTGKVDITFGFTADSRDNLLHEQALNKIDTLQNEWLYELFTIEELDKYKLILYKLFILGLQGKPIYTGRGREKNIYKKQKDKILSMVGM